MLKIILPIMALLFCVNINAQNTFKAVVKDSKTLHGLPSASLSISGTQSGATSDSSGFISLPAIPDGTFTMTLSSVGYESYAKTYNFPQDTGLFEIFLTAVDDDLEEVVVSSTRTSRTIANTPTRVETIEFEEIDEKSNMRPNNVAMLLHESTGIHVQQTSATSGNASIRMQGLDGRYTQLLKDGFPSYGNFANGLSILEIPPLDLRQVEIIKGPASTLYGAGAVAGVINFISKTPKQDPELNAIISQTHIGQTNAGVFSSARNKKIGYTILGLYSRQSSFDVDKDDFSEIPKSNTFTVHPKLFIYPSEKTVLSIGNSFTKGKMLGGDMEAIRHGAGAAHLYTEKNNTVRNITTADVTSNFSGKARLIGKAAYALFERDLAVPGFDFSGTNQNFFTDVSYVKNFQNQTLILGSNYINDRFRDKNPGHPQALTFNTSTVGIYAQHTFDATEKLKFENGLRLDFVRYGNDLYKKNQAFILPRVSVLYKWDDNWSSRIGGGLGYKTPTTFTEQTETFQYRNLMPLNGVSAERSIGGTADVNFRSQLAEELSFSINQMFFLSRVNNSNILMQYSTGNFSFVNTNKKVTSLGFETNVKFIYQDFLKLFLGYTFSVTKAGYVLYNDHYMPLVPKHRLNSALIAEKEDNYKIGLEAYYTSRQFLNDGSATKHYWDLGLMAEKFFGKFSVYINAENFLDTRQSRFEPVVSGEHTNPVFDEIWTHTEGRIFSAGVKFKL